MTSPTLILLQFALQDAKDIYLMNLSRYIISLDDDRLMIYARFHGINQIVNCNNFNSAFYFTITNDSCDKTITRMIDSQEQLLPREKVEFTTLLKDDSNFQATIEILTTLLSSDPNQFLEYLIWQNLSPNELQMQLDIFREVLENNFNVFKKVDGLIQVENKWSISNLKQTHRSEPFNIIEHIKSLIKSISSHYYLLEYQKQLKY